MGDFSEGSAPAFDSDDAASATGALDPLPGAEDFSLTAPWLSGTAIDPRYTCDGDDVAPALSWGGVPAGTVEIAIVMVIIGILTGGGDVPGLKPCIKAVVGRAVEAGHEVTVYDSLIRGHRAAVPQGATFVQGDIGDRAALVLIVATVAGFSLSRAVGVTAWYPWEQEYVPAGVRGKLSAIRSSLANFAGFLAVTVAGVVIGKSAGIFDPWPRCRSSSSRPSWHWSRTTRFSATTTRASAS